MESKDKPSKTKLILDALQRGERLNRLKVFLHYGTMCLAQRVHDLNKDGHGVQSQMVIKGKTKFAEYFIPKYQKNVPN